MLPGLTGALPDSLALEVCAHLWEQAPSLEKGYQKQTYLVLFLGQCVTEGVVGLSTPHFLYLLNEDVLWVCHED